MTTNPVLPFPPSPSRTAAAELDPDSPGERLLRSGGAALSDAEVVSLVLPGLDLAAARELLAHHGGLAGLLEADGEGLGREDRLALLAARELAPRLLRGRLRPGELLDHPASVADYLALRYAAADQEVMGALYLDVRNRLVAESEIFRGTLSRAAVEPRAILRRGLLASAAGLLLFHTHPSGDPSPSVEDLDFTRRMVEAGELLGIRLIDHLILGSGGRWVSLKRRGAW